MLMIIFGILLYFVGIDIEPFRYRMCNAPNLCICISFNSNKTQWNHFYFIYQRCKEWRVCKMKVIICLFIIIICILIASVHHFWWIMFTFHRTQPMQCKTSRGKSIFVVVFNWTITIENVIESFLLLFYHNWMWLVRHLKYYSQPHICDHVERSNEHRYRSEMFLWLYIALVPVPVSVWVRNSLCLGFSQTSTE